MQLLEPGSELVRLTAPHGEPIPVAPDSVVIPQTLAADQHLAIGDTLRVTSGDTTDSLRVTGISQQYLARSIYVSYPAATKAGLATHETIQLLQLRDPATSASLAATLRADDDVAGVTTRADLAATARGVTNLLDAVIVVIVLGAAALTAAVVLAISAVSLHERRRDYATAMALGVSRGEAGAMLARDNLVLLVLGCAAGLPAGVALFSRLTTMIATDVLTLPGVANPLALTAVVGLVALFGVGVRWPLRRSIRRIDLVDALKTGD